MPPRRVRGEPGPRELLRLVAVVVGWVGFVWMWVLVGRQPWDSARLVWLIVGTLIVAPLLTFFWVLHNRAIFRRKGERKAVAAAEASYQTDWHGRSVSADWAQLRESRFVVVGVDDSIKFYRSQDVELARGILEPDRDDPMAAAPFDTGAGTPLSRL